jgi:putative Mg2+ transporter-C (MgtC) family protein
MLTAFAAAFSDPAQLSMIFKLLLATSLGAVIGYEREMQSRPAGLRTHVLVAMGACVFAMLAFAAYVGTGNEGIMASSIVIGIGFMGAGTIVRQNNKIFGLTTAASLWLIASIGVAVATGFYLLAIAATVIGFFVLSIKPIEHTIRHEPKRAGR